MDRMTFKALFDHSSIGIIISNEHGIIENSNPFVSKIFGHEHGELNGKTIEDLLPHSIREKHVTYREQYNKDPHPRAMGINRNLLGVKKSGEEFPVEVSLTFFDSEGTRQIVSFINDITERMKAENNLRKLTSELEQKVAERTKELSDALLELGHMNEGLQQEMEQRKKVEAQIRQMLEKEKELNELKSRFVSMASHEFRTPLGGILSSTSLIAKYPNTEDEPKRQKHIQNIKKSVKNLTSILNDFLSLDKLEQGKASSNPVQFNFQKLLDELVEDMQETSDKKHEVIQEHLSGDITLFQDKEMVRNLVLNLLSNAFKYSPDGAQVKLRTEVREKDMLFEVQDKGMGIPLADQKHLFERFFRAKNVTNLQGTGLGLNIVRRYLDLMGGKISFKSIENEGTTFTITLPLEKT